MCNKSKAELTAGWGGSMNTQQLYPRLKIQYEVVCKQTPVNPVKQSKQSRDGKGPINTDMIFKEST